MSMKRLEPRFIIPHYPKRKLWDNFFFFLIILSSYPYVALKLTTKPNRETNILYYLTKKNTDPEIRASWTIIRHQLS